MRRASLPFLILLLCAPFANAQDRADGLIVKDSDTDVAATAERLASVLENKGMTVFARVDHTENAASVNLELPPTVLFVFGNPKVGTPFMQCAQTVAMDLPQKMLVWEGEDGTVHVGYNDPEWVAGRHGADDCAEVVSKIAGALDGLATAAAGG